MHFSKKLTILRCYLFKKHKANSDRNSAYADLVRVTCSQCQTLKLARSTNEAVVYIATGFLLVAYSADILKRYVLCLYQPIRNSLLVDTCTEITMYKSFILMKNIQNLQGVSRQHTHLSLWIGLDWIQLKYRTLIYCPH